MQPDKPTAAPVSGVVPVGSSAWSSGLFDCFDDCRLCCKTWWCPCITFGQVAEMVDGGETTCNRNGAAYALLCVATGWQFILSCTYRTRMRAQHGLAADEPCDDCCVHFWCEPCALCQEYRELVARGHDPKLGWHLNMERRAAAAGAPDVQQMAR